ncbi:MAG: hypothetical protein ACREKS_05590 [Candidatus Rokuibacteriota bacterium]
MRSADHDPKTGDKVVFADALAIGDLCYFDEPKDGVVVVRKLHEWEVAAFKGKIHRIEAGPKPGVAMIRPVGRDQLG